MLIFIPKTLQASIPESALIPKIPGPWTLRSLGPPRQSPVSARLGSESPLPSTRRLLRGFALSMGPYYLGVLLLMCFIEGPFTIIFSMA